MTAAVRIGFLAGRGISVEEIASQLDMPAGQIWRALNAARIKPTAAGGPTVHLIVPISAFIPELDSIGRRRKMSREEIACEILRVVFAEGERGIESVLARGEVV